MSRSSRKPPPVPLVKQVGRPGSEQSTAEIRFCRHHGWVAHHSHLRPSGSRRYRCKRCVGEAVTRRKQQVKRMLVEEAGGCCAVCGYDRTVVNLHFHHVDPATKRFPINMGYGKAIKTFREEARKCVLVCANCHGEIEAGLINSPPAGATFAVYGARNRCSS